PLLICRLRIRVHRSLVLFNRSPALVGVEAVHRLELIESGRAKVLLPHHSVLAHHERLHASNAVLCRSGHQCEASDHDALDHVVQLPQRSSGPLSLQDFEVVAVIRHLFAVVALRDCRCDLFADRSAPCSVRVLPRQAVLLARAADDALRILVYVVTSTLLHRVLMLSLDKTMTDLDRIEFIRADPPVQDLLMTLHSVEVPLAAGLHDRNGERPFTVSNQQISVITAFRLERKRVFLMRLSSKIGDSLLILCRFVGEQEVVRIRPEYPQERVRISVGRRSDQRVRGGLCGRKSLRSRGRRRGFRLRGKHERSDDDRQQQSAHCTCKPGSNLIRSSRSHHTAPITRDAQLPAPSPTTTPTTTAAAAATATAKARRATRAACPGARSAEAGRSATERASAAAAGR